MSKTTELAEAEATKAEAEPTTPPEPTPEPAPAEPGTEPAPSEPAPEGEPAQPSEPTTPSPGEQPGREGPTQAEMEAAFKKIGTSFKTYTRSVNSNLGEQALDLEPCPLCTDAIPGFLNKRDAGHVPLELQNAVLAWFGMRGPAMLKDAPDTERCPRCGGFGELRTGSQVPNWENKTCEACNGAGFTGPGNPMFAPPVAVAQPPNTEPQAGPVDLSAAIAAMQPPVNGQTG